LKITKYLIMLLLFTSLSIGMSFSANPNYRGVNLIYGSGMIHRGDLQRLKNIYSQLSKARQTILVLNSGGGELHEGIEIGKFLAQHRIGAAVRKYGKCASSCALAFLGGRSLNGSKLLILPRGSRLGFHKFYYRDRNYVSPVQVQNDMAELMSYTNLVAAPRSLVTKMLNTDPDHLYWVSNYERSSFNLRARYKRVKFDGSKSIAVKRRVNYPSSNNSYTYIFNPANYVKYYLSKINTLINSTRGAIFANNIALNDIKFNKFNRNWLSNNLNYVYIQKLKQKRSNKIEAKVIYSLKNGQRICSNTTYNLYKGSNGWLISSKSHKGCDRKSRKLLSRYASLLP